MFYNFSVFIEKFILLFLNLLLFFISVKTYFSLLFYVEFFYCITFLSYRLSCALSICQLFSNTRVSIKHELHTQHLCVVHVFSKIKVKQLDHEFQELRFLCSSAKAIKATEFTPLLFQNVLKLCKTI